MYFLYKKARMLLMIPIGFLYSIRLFNTDTFLKSRLCASPLKCRGLQVQAFSLVESEGKVHILHRLAGGSLEQIVYH